MQSQRHLSATQFEERKGQNDERTKSDSLSRLSTGKFNEDSIYDDNTDPYQELNENESKNSTCQLKFKTLSSIPKQAGGDKHSNSEY